MSKTEGNFIDLARLRQVIATYGEDALRYYLLRAAPFGSDLNWSEDEFQAAFRELADRVGNCLNRVLKMLNNYRQGVVPGPSGPYVNISVGSIATLTTRVRTAASNAYEGFALQQVILLALAVAKEVDDQIEIKRPFKLAKQPEEQAQLDNVLYHLVRGIYGVLVTLLPILPEKAAAGLKQLGVDPADRTWDDLFDRPIESGHKVGEGRPLFPKLE
jgi:methionyl-tRNA synthetase